MEIKDQNLLNAYKVATDEQKDLLKAMFPEFEFEPETKDNRPVEERIKTFEDALNALGEDNALVKEFRYIIDYAADTSERPTHDLEAFLKLRIIAAALNEGWQPEFSEEEYRWYPWFILYSADELAEKSEEWKAARVIVPLADYRVVGRSSNFSYAYGGLVCAYAGVASSISVTSGGSRLAFKSEALANYAARQFASLWADFYLIHK